MAALNRFGYLTTRPPNTPSSTTRPRDSWAMGKPSETNDLGIGPKPIPRRPLDVRREPTCRGGRQRGHTLGHTTATTTTANTTTTTKTSYKYKESKDKNDTATPSTNNQDQKKGANVAAIDTRAS